MATVLSAVNAGPRLDRLQTSPLHRRVMWLVGIGMFFDGFDIYVAATVLSVLLKTGFATLGQTALFVSLTFLGSMVGSLPPVTFRSVSRAEGSGLKSAWRCVQDHHRCNPWLVLRRAGDARAGG